MALTDRQVKDLNNMNVSAQNAKLGDILKNGGSGGSGEKGDKGDKGVGIKTIASTINGQEITFTFTMTDNTTQTTKVTLPTT